MPDPLVDQRRLAMLRDLRIIDTPSEPAYDDIARLVATACGADIAAVNFVDEQRHWTKAIAGVPDGAGASVDADVSFCAATVRSDEGSLIVEDTHADPAFRDHPLVTGGPKVRHYAGEAVIVDGEGVGVLCFFGDQPRRIAPEQREALSALARQTALTLGLRRRNESLRDLALHDSLTGLANRTLLLDHLELAIAQHRRDRAPVGVLYCDIDHFKCVNDEHGHDAGDRLLRAVAGALASSLRATDTAARIAGDEFVAVCPQLESGAELDAILARVREAMPTSVSIGATLLEVHDDSTSVLARADQAMYAAKQASRATPAPSAAGTR